MTESLDELLAAQIERVDRRVTGGGDIYASERDEVRVAARAVHDLCERLDLGRFLGPVGYPKAKPQFLLLFERGVLKAYGRVRAGEARAQRLWHDHGVRVVRVLDAGDDPHSWLLMEHLDAAPVARGPVPALDSLTTELAGIMSGAHAAGDAGARKGLPRLGDALRTHLGGVLVAARRHGYPIRPDEDGLVDRLTTSDRPVILHGDLGGGNVVRERDGGLRILDACGYVGPAEFDAARWAARTGGAEGGERVLARWLDAEPGLDPAVARPLLGLELLMEAGVRELVKDERGEPAAFPDPATERLLAVADRLLGR
ncbi:phosphotransferase [Symbioplanes lichenis]|uniref:phosphotransferase n=1 Tax=Symbioplanes lichenis TaxID=1629072 RepID=UPI002739009E|nr:phosphotransferase [Actinoplanes lichenis]